VTGSTASVLGFAALVVTALALEAAARHRPDRVPAAQALAAAMRTTPGRAAVLAGWVWLGVHFLAR
jgi:hypothetical protein